MCAHLELLKKLSSLGSTVGVTGGYMFNAQYIVSDNVSLKLEGASHYLQYLRSQDYRFIS
jgi:hypothetical protein